MNEHQVSYDIYKPFGPSVLKSSVPQAGIDLINEINARLGDGRFQDDGTERLVDVVADLVFIHFLDSSFFLSTPAPLQIFFLLHLQ